MTVKLKRFVFSGTMANWSELLIMQFRDFKI